MDKVTEERELQLSRTEATPLDAITSVQLVMGRSGHVSTGGEPVGLFFDAWERISPKWEAKLLLGDCTQVRRCG